MGHAGQHSLGYSLQPKTGVTLLGMSIVHTVVLSAALLTSCSQHDTKLQITAEAFSRTADECLYDVRDRKFKYESSTNCHALGALSTQFIEAGGFRDETPDRIALIAEKARATAWMARAISAAGNRPLAVW